MRKQMKNGSVGEPCSYYSAGNQPQTLIKISRLLHILLISREVVISLKISENSAIWEATPNRAFINANSLNVYFFTNSALVDDGGANELHVIIFRGWSEWVLFPFDNFFIE